MAHGAPSTLPDNNNCTASPICSIGNLVWNDVDNDGTPDPTEDGLASVKVELFRDVDGVPGNGAETLVGWTYTDSKGFYIFNGQAPGTYQVKIPESNFQLGGALAGVVLLSKNL